MPRPVIRIAPKPRRPTVKLLSSVIVVDNPMAGSWAGMIFGPDAGLGRLGHPSAKQVDLAVQRNDQAVDPFAAKDRVEF